MIEQFFSGLPLNDVYIFDVHGHYGASGSEIGDNVKAEGVLKTMDSLGVDKMALSSTTALYADGEKGNREIIDVIKSYPNRFYGYITINPYYGYEDMLSQINKNKNLLGIKIHAACHKTNIDDDRYADAYEFADKNNLAILIHTWSSENVNSVAQIAKKYKNAKLILAHSLFTDYRAKISAIEAIKRFENIYADTARSSTYDGALEWVVNRIGTDRILYGSDLTFCDSRHQLGRIVLSKLTSNQKERILGLNAKELFSINRI